MSNPIQAGVSRHSVFDTGYRARAQAGPNVKGIQPRI